MTRANPVASSRKHTQFKTRAQKPSPIYDQNRPNKHDQNANKTIPFGAAHTYKAHIREYTPPPPPPPRTEIITVGPFRSVDSRIFIIIWEAPF